MLLWDASALVKRYALELGSPTVDVLFAAVPLAEMVTTFTRPPESNAATRAFLPYAHAL